MVDRSQEDGGGGQVLQKYGAADTIIHPQSFRLLFCPRPHRAEALSDEACLTSVAYIGPKSTTERPRKTKIGTEVAHVTCDSDTAFKVKRSKVNLQGAGHIVAASRTACYLCIWCCGKMLSLPFHPRLLTVPRNTELRPILSNWEELGSRSLRTKTFYILRHSGSKPTNFAMIHATAWQRNVRYRSEPT